MLDDGRPIWEQVASLLERQILDGSLPEEGQVPSTNELATFHRINPATAAKGINALVADHLVYKRRGVGMFVATGAQDKLRERRRSEFQEQYVEPLLAQAERLGIPQDQVLVMIKRGARP